MYKYVIKPNILLFYRKLLVFNDQRFDVHNTVEPQYKEVGYNKTLL